MLGSPSRVVRTEESNRGKTDVEFPVEGAVFPRKGCSSSCEKEDGNINDNLAVWQLVGRQLQHVFEYLLDKWEVLLKIRQSSMYLIVSCIL